MTGAIYGINNIQTDDYLHKPLYCSCNVYRLFQSEATFAEILAYPKMQCDVL